VGRDYSQRPGMTTVARVHRPFVDHDARGRRQLRVVNRHLGDPDRWTRVSSPIPGGYSRFTVPLARPGSWHQPGLVFVVTGPYYAENGPIQAGVVRLSDRP